MEIVISKDSLAAEKHPSEWVPHPDGGEYLIAGIDRPSFQYMQSDYQQKEQMIRSSGIPITDDFVHQSNIEYSSLIGKYLVLGWRDTPIKLEYSEKNAADLMAYGKTADDESYGMKLALWVTNQASIIQVRASQKKAAVLGKSSNSTSTAKDTQDSATTKKSKGKRSA
ncbi:hypothetical protein [Acinetobacter sp. ANC 5378]|uniref:hypothetical protein n=1 Tax=Acinetobacter sp. ANC 5378 TaxID=2731249 RepID=UPI0014901742|nr:hypothetical protein [Acinetobacter sp. ANC 5378]NNG82273.1 hypothetical protein [Acinetobacter sp. ANC 5378]